MKRQKSYGIIVFADDGNRDFVLLVQHRYGKHWSFPKGHMQKGETERDTAVREVSEETGLAVEINTGFRYSQEYSYGNIYKIVKYFASKHKMENLTKQEEEIADIMWCDIREADNIITYDDDKKMLKTAVNYMRNRGKLAYRHQSLNQRVLAFSKLRYRKTQEKEI